MCRLAAYLGPDIRLQRFLIDPPHSLIVQATAPEELVYAKLNADGFGIGWYAEDDRPAIYSSPQPIWADHNLPELARSLSTDLWLAMVRSATAGLPVHALNSQPFRDEDLLFMHNGFLTDFVTDLRPRIRDHLDPLIEAEIRGNTDSEYLFALLRHLLADDEDLPIETALMNLYELLAGWLGDRPALLNLVVSEGERIYATRHAFNHACPSLYYTTDDEAFPGAQLVASERLTPTGYWQSVPEYHLLILDPEAPPDLIPL